MSALEVVGPDEWKTAHAELLAAEKAHTRATDALAARRRRAPMMAMGKGHVFAAPGGEVGLSDLFEGRRQLILYSFMLPDAGSEPCGGCSFFTDQVGHLAHLHQRDTTLALIAPAPIATIQALQARMGWGDIPFYSTAGNTAFYEELGIGSGFALNVFLQEGDRILRTYTVSGRGTEKLGSTWTFLDLTPMGRQETWEDAPDWVEQTPPYEWWRLHDEYASAGARA
ncbi:hypothetical protein DSM112329_02733 [Paraconexibacter sp. AEG42_29]|uniref:DUF899 domain-containing protein n=1 Tax=Paraconexibacter sp. AEG42_29 TaxID=2997339 RepID=A0AAU7AW45_9ACTN